MRLFGVQKFKSVKVLHDITEFIGKLFRLVVDIKIIEEGYMMKYLDIASDVLKIIADVLIIVLILQWRREDKKSEKSEVQK